MNDWNSNQNDPWAQQETQDPYAAPKQPYHSNDGYAGGGLPKSTNGTIALILGIASIFMCGIFTALPGWLIARGDYQKMKAGMLQQDSALEAGYWINLILCILGAVGVVLFVAMMFVMLVAEAVA